MLATLTPGRFCGGDLKRALGHPGLLGESVLGHFGVQGSILWGLGLGFRV